MADGWTVLTAISESVAALGTMGALIVGALVFREQQKDKREAQARRVFITAKRGYMGGPEERMIYTAHNRSDLPIFDTFFVTAEENPSGIDLSAPSTLPHERSRLDPGEIIQLGVEYRGELEQPTWLIFRDCAGRLVAAFSQRGLTAS